MATAQADDMLTAMDVAERLGVSLMTVSRWMRAGELRAINVASGPRSARRPRWRVLAEDFQDFLERRSNRSGKR